MIQPMLMTDEEVEEYLKRFILDQWAEFVIAPIRTTAADGTKTNRYDKNTIDEWLAPIKVQK
jgi:hypothetical protein